MSNLKDGFLYTIVNAFLNSLKYINLVEFFKFIALKKNSNENTVKQRNINSRIAVDLFVVLKWVFVSLLWLFNSANSWLVIFVWYLLISNLYTYFYYHSWSSAVLEDVYFDTDRIKRRFFNLLIALLYSIYGFGYLYNIPYSNQFSWGNQNPSAINSLWYSISNSFTASYDVVKPLTQFAHTISIVQLVMTFIFVTILISSSIPQVASNRPEIQNGV